MGLGCNHCVATSLTICRINRRDSIPRQNASLGDSVAGTRQQLSTISPKLTGSRQRIPLPAWVLGSLGPWVLGSHGGGIRATDLVLESFGCLPPAHEQKVNEGFAEQHSQHASRVQPPRNRKRIVEIFEHGYSP